VEQVVVVVVKPTVAEVEARLESMGQTEVLALLRVLPFWRVEEKAAREVGEVLVLMLEVLEVQPNQVPCLQARFFLAQRPEPTGWLEGRELVDYLESEPMAGTKYLLRVWAAQRQARMQPTTAQAERVVPEETGEAIPTAEAAEARATVNT
jgi:hypothetical protein